MMDQTRHHSPRPAYFPRRSPSISSSSLSRIGTSEDDKPALGNRQRQQQQQQQQQQQHSPGGSSLSPWESSEKEGNGCGQSSPQRQSNKLAPSRQCGTYRSTPLRWPFLLTELVLLAAALFIVVALQRGMPGSDNSAIVDGRYVAKRAHNTTIEPKLPDACHSTASGDDRSSRREEIKPRDDSPETGASIAASTASLVLSSPVDPAETASTTTAGSQDHGLSTPEDVVTGEDPALDPIWGGGQPSNVGVAFPPPKKTKTSVAVSGGVTTTSGSGGVDESRTTDFVVHTTHIQLDSPQTIKETAAAEAAAVPTPQLAPQPLMPSSRTIDVVVDASSTTFLVTTAPQTTQTVVAVFGGRTTRSVVPDDGLVGETSTLLAVISGTSVTLLAITTPGRAITETSVSIEGGTATTVTPPPVTFTTDLGGGRIATLTSTPSPFVTTTGGSTTTLVRTTTPGRLVTTAVATTIDGTPTSLLTVLTMTPTPSTRWATTPPSATSSGSGVRPASGDDHGNSNGTTTERVLPAISAAKYFAGNFLPTLIAVVLAIPVAVIDLNAKLLQPFRTLATDGGSADSTSDTAVGAVAGGGAAGSDTLTLRFGGGFLGIRAVTTPISQAFRRGQPVPLLTSMLVWLSWLLAPLAAEAISFKLHGTCSRTDPSGCGIELGVSPGPTLALVVVLALMLALLLVLSLLLRRWETGLHANPWSPAAIASLSLHRNLRDRLMHAGENTTEKDLVDMFAHGRFRLQAFAADEDDNDDGSEKYYYDGQARYYYEYGIVPVSSNGTSHLYNTSNYNDITGRSTLADDGQIPQHTKHMPFPALTHTWQGVFAAALLGLMALLIYYHRLHEYNSFERFMDSETFGVKFLFAALGTAISAFWTSFFQSVATMAPFRRMALQPRPAQQSVLAAPPTNAYAGMAAAVRQHDALLLAAALMAGVAELFLPVLLANIPYALTQTLESYTACAGATLGVLAAMIAVLAVSMLWVRWPHMPVDPRTLAGAIYYMADSGRLLRDLRGRGLSTRDCRSRDAAVKDLGRQYFYGRVQGSNGRSRMVVDAE